MIDKTTFGHRGFARGARARVAAGISAGLALLVPFSASGSITGVCPDGSIFIVQSAGAIPCRGAKQVDPSDVPPLKPEYLPRPYGWEVFNRRNDPNNPYNLIRSAPIDEPVVLREQAVESERVPVRSEFVSESVGGSADEGRAVAQETAPPQTASLRGSSLELANREIRDLAMIVDLSQRQTPAALMSRGSGGRVQLAMSRAFDARLRQGFEQSGRSTTGNAVLFSVDTQVAGSFYGNLTFVQGHIAYQPDTSDPFQLAVIHGSMGELVVDEPVLGYVIVPEHIDLSQPIDIYWNDIQITATLNP